MIPPPIRTDLFPIAEEAWRLYRETRAPAVIRPSIPILYFGDSKAYAGSPLRIVTVGLNPSRIEFPTDEPFRRFPEGAALVPTTPDVANYLDALDDYFRTEPYHQWFSSFEHVLRGAGASYYGPATSSMPSMALHTDLLSPLATDPTWSRLGSHERADLARSGVALWHKLARALRPHIILISVAQRHIGDIRFPAKALRTPLHVVERKNPYRVTGRWMTLENDHRTLVVFGQAAQKPFGLVSHTEKERIGASIRMFWEEAEGPRGS